MRINCLLALVFLLVTCKNESDNKGCPHYELFVESPYNDPIWHPSGEIIGFNHVPIKEINYINGYDCPHQAEYIFEQDSAGFWLINADGSNQRRVLPYMLECPAWSPDGKWIAFSSSAQICIMPFDGEQFDTTAIIQLTFGGRNFFPSWSPDGEWIAYDSDSESLTGLKFIWKMRNNGLSKRCIAYTPDKGETRMPSWGSDFSIVHQRYTGIINPELFKMDSSGNNVIQLTRNGYLEEYPRFSTDSQYVVFISRNGESGLWEMDILTKETIQLTTDGCMSFSISPNGEIVYTNYDYSRIDLNKGTLWIMSADGNEKRQLTRNNFKQIP
jgi:Tol biopolymer transport system component